MKTTVNVTAPIRSYKDLIVWKESMNFVQDVYRISAEFPKSEQLGLTSQMRRAAVSVPSNIAEGWSRNAAGSFIYFLRIATGSISELMTQIEIAYRLNYLTVDNLKDMELMGNRISKMLIALIRKVENRENSKKATS